ncbi:dTDP-4-dehydrorhamnose reductase [Salinithrix halophila]|uniref:dTDP-4-dehydrorhamnose reductase n=1 Tax=Salinithrix halophila TaxID=1485204 RepID=A0ABV8JGU8_9BACL
MKVLITGANGQLGRDMLRVLARNHRVTGFSREEWDICDHLRTHWILRKERPDAVIHCAAYTDVDGSEDHPRKAYLTNTKGTKVLADGCGAEGVRLVYISTDYVFDGHREEGYTERSIPFPINVYGKTKRMGERWVERLCPDHLILRTAWVYGHGGHNFPRAILERARRNEPLRVVHDQRGSPTYTVHLAEKTAELLVSPLRGILHTAGGGDCSWYEFADAILARADWSRNRLTRISSCELDRKAPRPAVSILRTERLPAAGIEPLPHWKQGLDAFFDERRQNTHD